MAATLCLLLHPVFATAIFGRSSSYPSFTEKKLRPREAKELSGGHKGQVGIVLASHCPLCFWYRGENTESRATSPGLQPQLHTSWLCGLRWVASCFGASISLTLNWTNDNCLSLPLRSVVRLKSDTVKSGSPEVFSVSRLWLIISVLSAPPLPKQQNSAGFKRCDWTALLLRRPRMRLTAQRSLCLWRNQKSTRSCHQAALLET